MTRITSKVSTLNETCFVGGFFNIVEENRKQCILIQDNIYVKNLSLYQGSTLFRRATAKAQYLAKTVL